MAAAMASRRWATWVNTPCGERPPWASRSSSAFTAAPFTRSSRNHSSRGATTIQEKPMPEDRTRNLAGRLSESAERHPDYSPNTGVTRESVSTAAGHLSYLIAGPDSGPLVVLVHGWPAPALTWGPQIDALSAAGYRVAAPDMRGYGSSSKPDNADAYAQRHLVADMRSLIEYLGHESAIWVGHDWGAATVWGLAAHHPELCQGVVAACVPYRSLERGYTEML